MSRLVPALLGVTIAVVATGSGGSAAERAEADEAPVYGVLASMVAREPQTLVRLDPGTLRPVGGPGVRLAAGLTFAGRSPDGRLAGFFDYRRPVLRIVDLEGMRVRGDVVVGVGSRWRTRAAAWLTADRLAVVVQRMRGAYGQIVDRREVVLVDPLARRAIGRRLIAGRTALQASASGGDKLVLMLGRGDRRDRSLRIVAIDSAGEARFADVDLEPADGPRVPSLVVAPSGRRAFLVAPGASVVELDLETMELSSHPVSGGGAVFAPPARFGSRHALWVDARTLAVTGHDYDRVGGMETSRPVGVALVDTTTWQARLIDTAAGGAAYSAGTLLAYGFRVERGRRGQELVGIGVRAYGLDGARRWQAFAGQAVTATAFRDLALVYRHGLGRPGGSFVLDLESGRRLGRAGRPEANFWLLPDAPSAPIA